MPVVYVSAMFLTIMTTTIVNVALPTIGRDLRAPAGAVALVPIAYLVALTVAIPAAGWVGDRLGGRTAILTAIAVFVTGSSLCSVAQSIGWLVVSSAVMGLGAAIMTPVGLAMLFRTYPPDDRIRVSSVLALFTSLAPALGPVLGGVLTSFASWRWVYLVNVPIGLAVLAYAAILLDVHAQPSPGPLDLPGLALSIAGIGALILGVSSGPVVGWSDPRVIAAIAVGIVGTVALVIVELRRPRPLIDFRLLRDRLLAASTTLYALGSVAYIGGLFTIALYLQDGLGFTAVTAGLLGLPSAVGVASGGQLVGRVLVARIGTARTVVGGLIVMSASLALLGFLGRGAPTGVLVAVIFGLGLGTAAVFIPAQAVSMTTISKTDTGRAASLYNAGKQLGSAIGVAVLSAALAAGGSHAATGATTSLGGFHLAFFIAAAIALAAVGIAMRALAPAARLDAA